MDATMEFDFDADEKERGLYEYWAVLEKHAAKEFSEESLCRAWLREIVPDLESWNSLRNYEREHYLNIYRVERHTHDRMRKAVDVISFNREAYEQNEAISASWARQIKEAALNNKACPIMMSPDMTLREKADFRQLLARAFQIAGVVIVKQ